MFIWSQVQDMPVDAAAQLFPVLRVPLSTVVGELVGVVGGKAFNSS